MLSDQEVIDAERDSEIVRLRALLIAQAAQLETVRQERWQLHELVLDALMVLSEHADCPISCSCESMAPLIARIRAAVLENTPENAKVSALTILPPPDGEP